MKKTQEEIDTAVNTLTDLKSKMPRYSMFGDDNHKLIDLEIRVLKEFYPSDDDRYTHKIHIVRWNTRSTRMSVYYSRLDSKKNKWIFRRESGLKRQRHGEKMR